MLASYAAVACLVYGALIDMWFWPYDAGTATSFSFQPGAGIGHNLARFLAFDLTTSLGLRHPSGRPQRRASSSPSGRPVISALRRASHKAAFGAAVELPGDVVGPTTLAAGPKETDVGRRLAVAATVEDAPDDAQQLRR